MGEQVTPSPWYPSMQVQICRSPSRSWQSANGEHSAAVTGRHFPPSGTQNWPDPMKPTLQMQLFSTHFASGWQVVHSSATPSFSRLRTRSFKPSFSSIFSPRSLIAFGFLAFIWLWSSSGSSAWPIWQLTFGIKIWAHSNWLSGLLFLIPCPVSVEWVDTCFIFGTFMILRLAFVVDSVATLPFKIKPRKIARTRSAKFRRWKWNVEISDKFDPFKPSFKLTQYSFRKENQWNLLQTYGSNSLLSEKVNSRLFWCDSSQNDFDPEDHWTFFVKNIFPLRISPEVQVFNHRLYQRTKGLSLRVKIVKLERAIMWYNPRLADHSFTRATIYNKFLVFWYFF